MKTVLLLSLAALTFGALPSCSNILEGDFKATNSETGVLSLSLEQDNSVNVVTKAGTFDGTKVTLTDAEIDDFDVTVKMGETTVTELTGKYSAIKGKSATVATGDYTLTATYGTMNDDPFKWDAPCFDGTESIKVLGGKLTTGEINCSLSNSIVTVDADSFSKLKESITVTNMVVITGTVTDDSSLTSGTSLLESGNLKTGTLYAAPNLTDAKIVLEGYPTNDTERTFRAQANILTGENVGSKNKYNVDFNLNSDKGSLSIQIVVNGDVTAQTVTVDVNPYK
ncbi:DUF4493 domain-containing protein [Parabacteroides distasonis]|uniref:DUF4493 domain-containing protein n=1 Tax=Parabacteroides distasonis TaxID=823 RepID=UPI00189EA82E|nr:DUF4493 domain-containing protein [Parabacteroides distasonis]MDB9152438.1 DUF4493 domain-containing protein [Parabacteroides distasonis]MDB9157014.1 DUF4493 domain-containing protein [Parabacteroides distasonis]MDB9166028.1 DUF4493 domain-containing protein [Parabacteroides distasonis]MDB9170448.1 DUF4493 domain-containing protein [Parabacteroides distasonis]MDB9194959.1 DUF4493 domain-containing protein [Parabacteroides distasonis]